MADGEQNQKPGGENQTQQEQAPKWAQELTQGISKLVQLAEASATRAAPKPASEEEEEEEVEVEEEEEGDPLEDTDLELLPRREFARRLQESFKKLADKATKGLETQVNKTAEQVATERYTREAVAFAEKTPDFAEWRDEMMGIAKDNPNLSIARIYALARAENPDKAAKIDKQYSDAKAADETKKAEAEAKTRKKPLALAPSGPASGNAKNQKMKPDEAAQAAWEETIEKFGGSPFAA